MERLSSLKFTLASLSALMIWLGLGVFMGQPKLLAASFFDMNRMLILDWLLGPAWLQPLAPLWFLGLCLGVGVMLLNLGACTFTRLLPRLRAGNALKGWLLTLVHLVMLVVLLGHGAEMAMGHKQEELRMLPGQTVALPGGLTLSLEAVRFVSDLSVINLPYRRARWVWTSTAFKLQDNWARVVMRREGQEVSRGELRILEPMEIDGLRLTLAGFYSPESEKPARVGVRLALVHNPLTTLFFVAYGAWVLLYAALALVTWRGGPSNNSARPAQAMAS
ncbi:MAG: hypothetical protein KJ720_05660 [Proteobacteria bacterium]|nr:hypothetical protein [Pseudomonadota bacterium]MBU1449506.1 hypothetical protein [Pseudomonadota bacterium]MBU2467631.1 hypothetical protein [Pseudomonadota bacterium]MBU2516186.1 hypothetical protein [Pseudomonadota bacterium]